MCLKRLPDSDQPGKCPTGCLGLSSGSKQEFKLGIDSCVYQTKVKDMDFELSAFNSRVLLQV